MTQFDRESRSKLLDLVDELVEQERLLGELEPGGTSDSSGGLLSVEIDQARIGVADQLVGTDDVPPLREEGVRGSGGSGHGEGATEAPDHPPHTATKGFSRSESLRCSQRS